MNPELFLYKSRPLYTPRCTLFLCVASPGILALLILFFLLFEIALTRCRSLSPSFKMVAVPPLISGAGVATIAFLWESVMNNLTDSAAGLKIVGFQGSASDYRLVVIPLIHATIFGVILALHCAVFTLEIVREKGFICVIPRPCYEPTDLAEAELRLLRWLCVALYVAARLIFEVFVLPLDCDF